MVVISSPYNTGTGTVGNITSSQSLIADNIVLVGAIRHGRYWYKYPDDAPSGGTVLMLESGVGTKDDPFVWGHVDLMAYIAEHSG